MKPLGWRAVGRPGLRLRVTFLCGAGRWGRCSISSSVSGVLTSVGVIAEGMCALLDVIREFVKGMFGVGEQECDGERVSRGVVLVQRKRMMK